MNSLNMEETFGFEDILALPENTDDELANVPIEGMATALQVEETDEKLHRLIDFIEDQDENMAVAGEFPVTDDIRIRRFLMFGNYDGTYSEKSIMKYMAPLALIIDKGKGFRILEELYEFSVNRKMTRNLPGVHALALCARYRGVELRKQVENRRQYFTKSYCDYLQSLRSHALSLVKEVCRDSVELFKFVKLTARVLGWTSEVKEVYREWYYNQSPDVLAMTVLSKYTGKERRLHMTMFTEAHDDPTEGALRAPGRYSDLEQIFRYVVDGKMNNPSRHSKSLNLLESLSTLTHRSTEEEIVRAIWENGLLPQHIPLVQRNSLAVWEALLMTMPLSSLLSNLIDLQRIGLLKGPNVEFVCRKILDENAESRIHPLTFFLTLQRLARVRQGESKKKRRIILTPIYEIRSALEEAFYASIANYEPTGKRFCYAFDVSGSMCRRIGELPISCRSASIAMGMIGVRTENKCDVVAFADGLTQIPFDKSWTLWQTEDYFNALDFSPTDCALPMLWATENKKEIDVFVVFTDNKTNYGKIHPSVALKQYRMISGIKDARLVVIGMSSDKFTIADPQDAGMLDISGFDCKLLEVISNFAK